jgi:lysophospholipase L1-like esterase
MRAIWKHAQSAWLILGITLLLFCLVELAFALAFAVKDRLSPPVPSAAAGFAQADTYADQNWVAQYFDEFDRSAAARWESYVYWRRRPFQGAHINVDESGIRRTISPPRAPSGSPDPLKIHMFGGSAMWGTGARDEFTIPSILARDLAGRGLVVEITNFGESGYVSTQEVIALLRQLQGGERPDLVIFLDGANDTFSAYQQQVAGIPQNEFNRVQEFNLSQPEKLRLRVILTLRDVARDLASARFAKWLLQESGLLPRSSLAVRPAAVAGIVPGKSSLATSVVDTYRSNIDIVRALGVHYRFQHLFYWQPTVFDKTLQTEFEAAEQVRLAPVAAFSREVRLALSRSDLASASGYSFADLGPIVAGVREPVFVDWCHLGEFGNEIIARRMAADVFAVMTREERSAGSGAR